VPDRVSYAVNVCVLLRRADRWLPDLRQLDEDDSPGLIGLIGGHVELADGPDEVFETAARRELAEETGIDLSGTMLHYVASELYDGPDGRPVLTVTYAAELPADQDLRLERATEPGRPAWWTLADAEDDPRCAPWVPRLIRLADAELG
jgi:8-oxo-dGTP pyrophosphatase MutT (NUDIX family)